MKNSYNRTDFALMGLLVLLPCLFFWRLVTPNPTDRLSIVEGDFTAQYFPLRAFTAQEWVAGRIPLWNPYLFGGQPALADIQSGALYPIHVLQALILSWGSSLGGGHDVGFPVTALVWQVLIHFSIAAVGTYLFARQLICQQGQRLKQAQFAGLIASLTFTYGGYLTSFPVQQLTILEVSVWLPWVLWSMQPAKSLPHQFRPAIKPAMFLALAILAGHPQTTLYIVYLSLAYSLFQAWQTHASYFRAVRYWGLIILLAMGLTAPQLLPTVEFIQLSVRADLSFEAVSQGLPLAELISILYPGYNGGSPQYIGWASLGLVIIAWVIGYNRQPIWFWTAMSLMALMLSFGQATFMYSIFYLLMPGFEQVRQQERVFFIYSFSLAMLAGYGAALLSGPLPRPLRQRYRQLLKQFERAMLLCGLITILLIYGSTQSTLRGDEINLFYGVLRHHLFALLILGGLLILLKNRRRLTKTWGMGLMAAWLAVNLFTVHWQYNLTEPNHPFQPNGMVQFLQQHGETNRVVSGGHLPGGHSAASVYQLSDLTGNTPLRIATVDQFMARLTELSPWRMWQLMQVRYVVSERDLSGPGLAMRYQEEGFNLFEVLDPFPKAWFVGEVEAVANQAEAMTRLGGDEVDLRQTAIVSQPLPDPIQAVDGSEITLRAARPNHLRFETTTSAQQLLVISQIYYPGWHVTIDGQPAELLPVNAIQQGVVVPAGEHTVELTFWPMSFWLGGLVALMTGGLCLGLGLLFRPNQNS